jgi:hypothetical protein
MKEKIWEKNHAGNNALPSSKNVVRRDGNALNNYNEEVGQKW